ncbi:MAG: hypothetical protein FWB86_10250 [Treponema sp.]|nr:hypothetical protein [Treponema sp.]
MNNDINPTLIKLPPELEGRLFLTANEFGKLVGKTGKTIHQWRRKGWLKMTQFSPRYYMIPVSEVGRFMRGEMMAEKQQETPV